MNAYSRLKICIKKLKTYINWQIRIIKRSTNLFNYVKFSIWFSYLIKGSSPVEVEYL